MSLFDGSCTKQLTYFDVTKCIDSSTNEPNGDDESIAGKLLLLKNKKKICPYIA